MLHPVPLPTRVSAETRQRLGRLRSERHLNLGSWLRALIEEALDREFGPAPPAADEPTTTRFVQKYTLRVAPSKLGGGSIFDLAVEDDVLPLDGAEMAKQGGIEGEVRCGGQA